MNQITDYNAQVYEQYITDIHMHVIPMVDDGSESMEMSMEMLRRSYHQGVRTIFCTPHGGVFYSDKGKQAQEYFEEMERLCKSEMPDLQLYFGAEVRMLPEHMDYVMHLLDAEIMPTLANTEYVLAEFTNGYWVEYNDMIKSIYRLRRAGYVPIVAHVERYYTVIPDIAAAKRLHDLGCYFQINAYSITEEKTYEVRTRAAELLEAGLVDFIGSDAHRTNHRPPMLINGVRQLYQKYDKEYVDRMVYKNVKELILKDSNSFASD